MKALTAARAIAARVGSRLVSSPTSTDPPLVLLFSKDRAIRLELFLRSYAQHVSRPLPITVLYLASSDAHRQAYEEVFAAYRALELTAIAEGAFKPDLLAVLRASSARHVLFFMDDIVFLHPVDTRLLEQWDPGDGILSLRLGRNITHCADGDAARPQPQPELFEDTALREQPLARWRWSDGQLDWAQPTSLNGHLLPLPDLVPVIEQASFEAPASLDAAIGQYKFLFKGRWGYCWEQARIMSLPFDPVTSEPDGATAPQASDEPPPLLQAFQRGLRLDISELPLAQHNSCRMPWAPALRRDTERPAAGG